MAHRRGKKKNSIRPPLGSKPSLGLAMIMKNEENNLPLSLGTLKDKFYEIVCVDTGSIDKSRELARGYGAKVVETSWEDDFSAARNFGLEQMRADFILWLDADNSIAPNDLNLITQSLINLKNSEIILTAVEKVIPQGETLWQKRVFPNSPLYRFQGRVHEQLVHPLRAKIIHSGAQIHHWGYGDLKTSLLKGQRDLAILLSCTETQKGEFYYLYQTGRTLFNLGRFEEALKYLTIAKEQIGTQLRPNNPSLEANCLIVLSQAFIRLNRRDKAEETLRELCSLRPDYGPGRFYLGRLLYQDENYQQAAIHLSRALEFGCGDLGWGADPSRLGFTAASILAKTHEKLNLLPQAAEAWRLASDFNPSHPEPIVALAGVKIQIGQAWEARALLQKAIELAPTHRRARLMADSLEAGR
ncbi:MAG: glycosyltransferase [Deltaproteobacteria bacterium]|jgi:glycosyltransferase involved in cell wall biosynthesis|nr:glycosyltransferase [Deltaproteobacteria bacterium]